MSRVPRFGGHGRGGFFAAVLVLVVAALLASPRSTRGETRTRGDATAPLADAIPTWWHEAAGLTPLLTAPPPPNPATICIIDTGVTPTPDLDITARWAYDGGTLDDVHASDESPGHGTLVAHFAAGAVNGWGGAGALPYGRISSVRVFPTEGGASWQDYIRGITRCLKLDTNTKVIVISIGGQAIEPGEADELEHWIERARDRYQTNVVVAAGNGAGSVDFPGQFGAAFTATAVDDHGELCGFSARGPEVDIAAPGCGLVQAGWTGAQWTVAGTSFAAPIVAGAVAALRSYDPTLTARDAERAIEETAGGGALRTMDAAAALRRVDPQMPAPPREPVVPPSAGSPGRETSERRLAPAPASTDLPRPRARGVRTRRGITVLVNNRPVGVRLEVRIGARRLRRLADRISFRTRRRAAHCRFLDGSRSSRTTTVRWRA